MFPVAGWWMQCWGKCEVRPEPVLFALGLLTKGDLHDRTGR
jgi:hypothetical protein